MGLEGRLGVPGQPRQTDYGPCHSYSSQHTNGHEHSSNVWLKEVVLCQRAQSDSWPGLRASTPVH